jgi:hypothetical protein
MWCGMGGGIGLRWTCLLFSSWQSEGAAVARPEHVQITSRENHLRTGEQRVSPKELASASSFALRGRTDSEPKPAPPHALSLSFTPAARQPVTSHPPLSLLPPPLHHQPPRNEPPHRPELHLLQDHQRCVCRRAPHTGRGLKNTSCLGI